MVRWVKMGTNGATQSIFLAVLDYSTVLDMKLSIFWGLNNFTLIPCQQDEFLSL